MDDRLRILQRAHRDGDATATQSYIAALERAIGLGGDPGRPSMYLLATEGTRHEDRRPKGIFYSIEAAIDGAKRDYTQDYPVPPHDLVVWQDTQNGDYGQLTAVFIDTREGYASDETYSRYTYLIDTLPLNLVCAFNRNRRRMEHL